MKKTLSLIISMIMIIAAIAPMSTASAAEVDPLAWLEAQPDGTIVFECDGAAKGFIFYPGGKVEYTAYIPLMQALSEHGVTCVLVEMPFHLACSI